jgi:regulator of sirC expression with transglutaminase-like and TPR domain
MRKDLADALTAASNAPGTALANAALVIASIEYPRLDPEPYLAQLDGMGAAAADFMRSRTDETGDTSTLACVRALNAYLFQEQGFSGSERYEDPRNSCLNEVLDHRTGIPITLSLVYMEVARRAGVEVDGVGFPGHFLVKHGGQDPIVVDAFFQTVLTRQECQVRLAAVLGAEARLEPALHLRKATPREILVRLLGNLKVIYVRSSEFGRALACCERILLVAPDSPHELRDRGLVYEKLECFSAAAADLARFLELAPDDESAGAVRERLNALEPRLRQLH